MTPSILFFQAAATAIPTLAVAVAVSGKAFDFEAARSADEVAAERNRSRFITIEMLNTLLAVAYFAMATLGEWAALKTLLLNEPTWDRAWMVLLAFMVSAATLFNKTVIWPFMYHGFADRRMIPILTIVVVIAVAAFVLIPV